MFVRAAPGVATVAASNGEAACSGRRISNPKRKAATQAPTTDAAVFGDTSRSKKGEKAYDAVVSFYHPNWSPPAGKRTKAAAARHFGVSPQAFRKKEMTFSSIARHTERRFSVGVCERIRPRWQPLPSLPRDNWDLLRCSRH